MTVADAPVEIAEVQQSTKNVSHRPYTHIVVALDGSALAEGVLDYVEPLARAFGSKVTCVCAVEPISTTLLSEMGMPVGYLPFQPLLDTQEEIRAEDATYLADIKDRLAKGGIEVECEEPQERAAEAIVASARQHHAGLIAMATHGRRGLGRAVLGSVADEVLRKAPCPVLLVRNMAKR